MSTVNLPVRFAPNTLVQPILPNWFDHFSLMTVEIGQSSASGIETRALDEVGSYGRQIGHLAEAMEVIIEQLELMQPGKLDASKRDVLTVFLADVAKVRQIKTREGKRSKPASTASKRA